MGLHGTILLNIATSIVAAQQGDLIVTSQVRLFQFSYSRITSSAEFICGVRSKTNRNLSSIVFTSLIMKRTANVAVSLSGDDVVSKKESSTLVVLERSKSNGKLKLLKFFPPAKRWTSEYETITLPTPKINLVLTVNDFECNDAGRYDCLTANVNETDLRVWASEELTSEAETFMSLSLAPYNKSDNNTDQFSSTVEVGINITLTCDVTAAPNRKIAWTFKQFEEDEDDAADLKDGVTFYPGNKWLSVTGCITVSYASELHKKVQADDNGTTYYCNVMNADDEIGSHKEVTIWIKDLPSHNNGKRLCLCSFFGGNLRSGVDDKRSRGLC
ncbi:GATA zinc finger domain-containing protein 15 [Biomphalaria pfeifferi]|uniref:GATA zinc finger domain-containing protein 15 n=1 Tax=Biomphalaria pfeifferi TaxID=112525 RepID=A0AAD8C249_BIOPF|nr:GATA zinc finger domain-containing protein 15 [Biomphalaria pfeifferi]